MKSRQIDLEILAVVSEELNSLKDELVFLGGATVSLFVTEPRFIKIRETFDIDCVVEVAHRLEYEEIAKKLRKIGFNEDSQSSVICRFIKNDLILDVMPTDKRILGFSNIWYQEGFQNSIEVTVGKNKIKVFDLPYLMATKIEAFKGRGKNQYMLSHDIEDIVTLFDGGGSLAKNLDQYSKKINSYLVTELKKMISDNNFINSLEAHISDRSNIDGRKKIVINRILDFIKLAESVIR